MGIHMCPLKIWMTQSPHFCRFSDAKSTLWAPPFPNRGISRNLKQWDWDQSVAMWGCPYQTWWGSHHPPQKSAVPFVCGMEQVNRIDITSAVWQLATRCLILGVGFREQAIKWRQNQDQGCKGRCHGNKFWEYISCKWILTGENDMGISYERWFAFIVNPASAGCSLWIRSCGV